MFIDLSYEVFRWVRALGLVENYVCARTSVQRFVLVKVFCLFSVLLYKEEPAMTQALLTKWKIP